MRIEDAQPFLRVNPEASPRPAVVPDKHREDDIGHDLFLERFHVSEFNGPAEPSLGGDKRQLMQELVDALPAEVAIVGPDGIIVLASASWDATSDRAGADRNGFETGAMPEPWFGSDRDSRRIADATSLVLSGELAVAELSLTTTDRTAPRRFRLRIAPLGRDAVHGAVCTKEDVTEIHELHRAKQLLTEQLVRSEEKERRRIAREMHDSTVQDLVAIGLNLTRLRHLADDAVAQEVLTEVRTILARTQQDVRTMSYLLHPPLLDEGGLALALASLIRGLASRMDIRVDFDCDVSDTRLPIDIEMALYRVAQEALINVHKHASATHAVVRYHREADRIVLQVEDDGIGISGNGHYDGSGVGIQGMRARLAQLGGTLTFTGLPRGTLLSAAVPVGDEDSDGDAD